MFVWRKERRSKVLEDVVVSMFHRKGSGQDGTIPLSAAEDSSFLLAVHVFYLKRDMSKVTQQ